MGPSDIENLLSTQKDLRHLASTPTSDVYRFTWHGKSYVLKQLTEIGKRFESHSVDVLRAFDGKGTVKLFGHHNDVLILEDLTGPPLSQIAISGRDQKAAHIICEVLGQIHDSRRTRLPRMKNSFETFQPLFQRARDGSEDPLFYEAAKVASHLLETERTTCLLHGDIHHDNILFCPERGWLAIDPQSFFGERTYDFANSFYNPEGNFSFIESETRILQYAAIFAEHLETDRNRVLQFAFAYGGLSASWDMDDGKNPERTKRIARKIGRSLSLTNHD
jgi:streptomycin 6-kinase